MFFALSMPKIYVFVEFIQQNLDIARYLWLLYTLRNNVPCGRIRLQKKTKANRREKDEFPDEKRYA